MSNVATAERPKSAVVVNSVPLTISDRCDACGGRSDNGIVTAPQAFARAVKGDLEILFCGHHLRRHEAALIAGGWLIDDQTDRINEKPSTSANAD